MINFTPTEQRILNALSDGKAHPRDELMKCLKDELNCRQVLCQHVSNIRNKIKPYNQYIVCEMGSRPISYRHVVCYDRTIYSIPSNMQTQVSE